MNRCHRLFNALKSFARVMRFCMKPKFMPLTNTGFCDPSDQPKSIVTWNIQGLFYFMYKEKQDNIIRELHNFDQDIICLQEVFEDSSLSTVFKRDYTSAEFIKFLKVKIKEYKYDF